MQSSCKLYDYWEQLYPGTPRQLLTNFLKTIDFYRNNSDRNVVQHDWYKDAIVYSLYAELFNNDLKGIIEKLDYLQELGVNCIWLLPVLQSPMRDAGFDISDYLTIRQDLAGDSTEDIDSIFGHFLDQAHRRNIRVIFDIAINHVSDQHPWFLEAKKSNDNPYRKHFIWSRDTDLFQEARIIFKGIESSNWEQCGEEYYFHRFFSFQPDLNYRNPEVLLGMCRYLLYWQNRGVDGFRADAIPYLWKEEGTTCENLPMTHVAVKFMRALLDYVKPGSLLLAEACQTPIRVVEYLGNGDECHAAYHFPLMPRIFKAIAMQSGKPVEEILSRDVTPRLPENGQWFTFLRCHDELSLELVYVSEEERKFIHENYCHDPKWDFRMGEGISARLSELMERNPAKIHLAYSLILTLPGTPVIYYGDEFGKLNDEAYYEEMIRLAGKDDTRFLVRGKIDWQQLEKELNDPASFSSRVNKRLRIMLNTRQKFKVFGRGEITFADVDDNHDGALFAFERQYQDEHVFVIHNMSSSARQLHLPQKYLEGTELFGQSWEQDGSIEAYGFRWVKIQ